jgi:hypothetical protein
LQRARRYEDFSGHDVQFLLDVIVGNVFQRTLALKSPMFAA